VPTVTIAELTTTAQADIAAAINEAHSLVQQVRGMAEHAIRCGELLIQAKRQAGHGNWLPWLSLNCPDISEDTAGRYMKLARNSSKLADSAHERNLSIRRALKMIAGEQPHVANNSGDNEWYTPACYVEAARTVMGGIDVDPASCEVANRTVGASVFYTADDDGLTKPWAGRVWMNPPYAKGLVDQFAEKLIDGLIAGDVKQAVVLVNNSTDTEWWQSLGRASNATCYIAGRVKFLDESGDPSGAPLQGQAVLYFGPNEDAFVATFRAFGLVQVSATGASRE
jgi:hypothetical protein